MIFLQPIQINKSNRFIPRILVWRIIGVLKLQGVNAHKACHPGTVIPCAVIITACAKKIHSPKTAYSPKTSVQRTSVAPNLAPFFF